MLDRAGSIEGFFADGSDSFDDDVGPALDSFSSRALALDLRSAYGTRRPARCGVGYFFYLTINFLDRSLQNIYILLGSYRFRKLYRNLSSSGCLHLAC